LSAQAEEPTPQPPLDTAEAPPKPAYGISPDVDAPEPVSEEVAAALQGVWLALPAAGDDPGQPVVQLSIMGELLYQRDPASDGAGERAKFKPMMQRSGDGGRVSVWVTLTERAVDGAEAPDVDEQWVLRFQGDGTRTLQRGGVAFGPGPKPVPAPAYGIAPPPPVDVRPNKPQPVPKPVYGLPPDRRR
jgi:hypothetical protein